MTESYSQSLEVKIPSSKKRTLFAGIFSVMLALGFVIVAGTVNWLFALACVPFLIAAVICFAIYSFAIKEFIYSFSPERLVVACTDVSGRRKRMLSVLFFDVEHMSPLSLLVDEGDIFATDDASDKNVFELAFSANGKSERLVFKPDLYLKTLLKDKLGEKFVDYEYD